MLIYLLLISAASAHYLREGTATKAGECFNFCDKRTLGVSVQVRKLKPLIEIRDAWRGSVHTAATTGTGRTGQEKSPDPLVPDAEGAIDSNFFVSKILNREVIRHGGTNEPTTCDTRHRLFFAPLSVLGGVDTEENAFALPHKEEITACHVTAKSLITFLGVTGSGTSNIETDHGMARGQVAIDAAIKAIEDQTTRYAIHFLIGMDGRIGEAHSFTLITGANHFETLEAWAKPGETNSFAKQIAVTVRTRTARATAVESAKAVLLMTGQMKEALNGNALTQSNFEGFVGGRVVASNIKHAGVVSASSEASTGQWNGFKAYYKLDRCVEYSYNLHPMRPLDSAKVIDGIAYNAEFTINSDYLQRGQDGDGSIYISALLADKTLMQRFPCESKSTEQCVAASKQCTTDENDHWTKGRDKGEMLKSEKWIAPPSAAQPPVQPNPMGIIVAHDPNVAKIMEFTACTIETANTALLLHGGNVERSINHILQGM